MQHYYIPCTQQDRLHGSEKRSNIGQTLFRRSSAATVGQEVDSTRQNVQPSQRRSSQPDSLSQTPSLADSSSPSQQDGTSPRTPNSFASDDLCTIEQTASQKESTGSQQKNTTRYGGYTFLNGDALPSRPKIGTELEQPKQQQHSVIAPVDDRSPNVRKVIPSIINETAVRSRVARPRASVDADLSIHPQLTAKKAPGVVTFNSRCHARRRPCGESVTAAPPKLKRDTDCTDAIVRLIVCFSTKLVHTIWSESSTTPRTSSSFHGAGVLPLRVFIQETLRRSKTSYSTLQVALFYLILLKPYVGQHHNTADGRMPGCRALQCGRRMFLTALILASKYLQDRNYSSRAWSKISGLPINEINENERRYLNLIQFNLHMEKDTFENWNKIVLTLCKTGEVSMNRDLAQESSKSRQVEIADNDSIASDDEAKSGSDQWWMRQLRQLSADLIKDTEKTEAFLTSLTNHNVDSSIESEQLLASLETPPSSPDSASDLAADKSMTKSTPDMGNDFNQRFVDFSSSPSSVASLPTRPSLPNLPTPQTTPRFTRTLPMPKGMCQMRSRCKDSSRALLGLDRHAVNVANLETCPPPQPKMRDYQGVGSCVRREGSSLASCASVFASSPESMVSDVPSTTARSRSSSVSSSSSVWWPSAAQQWSEDGVGSIAGLRKEQGLSSTTKLAVEATVPSSYSFFHGAMSAPKALQDQQVACANPGQGVMGNTKMSAVHNESYGSDDGDIDTILASLTDRKISPSSKCPAVAQNSGESPSNGQVQLRRQKRDRSELSEDVLQHHVRYLLWDEPSTVEVIESTSSQFGITQDKQLQHPAKEWACLKKPIPNGMHTKRFALCHEAESCSTDLASRYLRDDITMVN